MLELKEVTARYGKSQVLQGVNLIVRKGEIAGLLGRNGVGKTTTLRSIMKLTPPSGGDVVFNEINLEAVQAYRVPALGIGYVPQGRGIFPKLTVYDNLCIGLSRDPQQSELDNVYRRFPVLRERNSQLGGTLSGGEQQQLAIARCLISGPKLLLLDEPTEGIMPILVAAINKEIKVINESGVSILLVEQNIGVALKLCDRIYFMEKGRISYEGTPAEIRSNPEVIHRYLGVTHA